ncbi:hypothetical protein LOK49_LG08G00706 [Camellia lanceoleosa]|uniref:Uncharacterized protein n=1 Tax=Camellia lanceoleosa TaxID=1840588 RepID=A0ACC0GSL8_9ERIC|nr:hypothetical protein LOK49_LG08G00706 [Camellia lanceoleosa]
MLEFVSTTLTKSEVWTRLFIKIDAPRTTVVRISNQTREAKKKLFSICRSYGKVKVVGFRHKEIRDVHFMLSEWPNMLKNLSRCGRCKLQNVKVLNEGIDWTSRNNTYWKHDVQRFEALKVILHGNAEFEATDVVFQTPEGSLLDIIRNAFDLLSHCDIKIPKFHGGSISKGSELQIEVAEFSWRNVQLYGSLIVVAKNILGSTKMDENGELKLRYWHRCGRCKLQNVKVLNEGIDWTSRNNTYWKHDVQRFEALKVILHGNAEFEATDVVFQVRDEEKTIGLIRKYGLMCCRQCFRSNAKEIGFIKYR